MYLPTAAENVERFGEQIVVDEARVHGEHAHEQHDVSSGEENVPDFVGGFFGAKRTLVDDHPGGEQRENDAVTQIAEHHSEQDRERDDGV